MSFIEFFIIKVIHKIIYLINKPKELSIHLNDWYHKIIFMILLPYFNKASQLLKNDEYKNEFKYNSNIIWVFWWQGYKSMPLLVHICINSIIRNSMGHKVILVTRYNIKKYAKISQYIYNKLENGNITLTHFSDILRFNLLYNYGGLWIDSTIYCTSPLTNEYFNNFYTSGGYQSINKNHQFISTKWTGFLIGGYKHSPVFLFMDKYFELYWKMNKYQLDYFLIDYGLDYVYKKNIGNFKTYVNKIAYKHNPCLYRLVNLLNDEYNDKLFKSLIKHTQLFKLTYKQNFSLNKNSFYGHLVKKYKGY